MLATWNKDNNKKQINEIHERKAKKKSAIQRKIKTMNRTSYETACAKLSIWYICLFVAETVWQLLITNSISKSAHADQRFILQIHRNSQWTEKKNTNKRVTVSFVRTNDRMLCIVCLGTIFILMLLLASHDNQNHRKIQFLTLWFCVFHFVVYCVVVVRYEVSMCLSFTGFSWVPCTK